MGWAVDLDGVDFSQVKWEGPFNGKEEWQPLENFIPNGIAAVKDFFLVMATTFQIEGPDSNLDSESYVREAMTSNAFRIYISAFKTA